MLIGLASLTAALTLLLTGAIAGFFYAYSVSAMPGLDRIEPEHAIRAMQGINEAVRNPVFFVTFFLMPVASLLCCGLTAFLGRRSVAVCFGLAAAVYLFGAFLPTALVNVPMNEALAGARLPADAGELERLWSTYSARWTAWNTVRTLFGLLSLLLVGLGVFAWGAAGRR